MGEGVAQFFTMRLLIVTQAVDKKHSILGFFHRWVEEFAKHFEHIHVIALQVGEYELPHNVTVHSLGKEKGTGRLQHLYSLFSILYALHRDYDAVFVHMNPEYIVLAGWLWCLTGKKIGLWYNHTVGSFWLRISQPFTNIIFHTSPYAYTARYKNALRMPAGIDMEVFKPFPDVKKEPRSIYFQGRIAPAKRIHILLETFTRLYQTGEANLLTLVGPEVKAYTKPLRARYATLIENGAVVFKEPIPNTDTPALYAAYEISVNLTDEGNYDKSVLESLACGTPAVVASKAFADIVPAAWILKEKTAKALSDTMRSFFASPPLDVNALLANARKKISEKESLAALGEKMYVVYLP